MCDFNQAELFDGYSLQGGGREGPLWGYSNPGVGEAIKIVFTFMLKLVEVIPKKTHEEIYWLGATTTDGEVFTTRRKDA